MWRVRSRPGRRIRRYPVLPSARWGRAHRPPMPRRSGWGQDPGQRPGGTPGHRRRPGFLSPRWACCASSRSRRSYPCGWSGVIPRVLRGYVPVCGAQRDRPLADRGVGSRVPDVLSGAPVIYPPLVALANDLGGLAAARVLSLCFMLGATSVLWGMTSRLADRRSAFFAAAFFAALGPTQSLGAFATPDAMALFLMTAAAWCVVAARDRADSTVLLLGGAGLLALANATSTRRGCSTRHHRPGGAERRG